MIKGILWDNDGVLVDTERLFYEANRVLFAGFDVALSEQHFFDWFLVDNRGAWHLLTARGMPEADIAAHRQRRNAIYTDLLTAQADPAIAGMAAVLARCASRVRMGIVTSSERTHFQLIHSKLDLLRHMAFVVDQDDYRNSKPDPEPYLLGLQKLGLAAHECVVVEDSPRGLQAALAAGIRCIVIRSPLTRQHAFPGAYRVVDSVAALAAELDALLPG